MLAAVLVAGALISCCIFMHVTALRWLRGRVLESGPVGRPLLKVMFALFALHVTEALLYALTMFLMEEAGLGHLGGLTSGENSRYFDYVYFSLASYTTLGFGDIVAHGPIRLVAALEALCGLILIAWSASFTYLVMERLWAVPALSGDARSS
jgi:hypothetical protein